MEDNCNPINALHRENDHNDIMCTAENMAHNIERYKYHKDKGELNFVNPWYVLSSLAGTPTTTSLRVPVESIGEKGGKHWEQHWSTPMVITREMGNNIYEPMTIKVLTGKSGLRYYFLSNQILTPEYVGSVADEYAEHNMLIEGLEPEVFKEDVYEYNPKTCIKSFYDEAASANASIALLLDANNLNSPILYEMYWDKGKITVNPVGSTDYGELARITVKEWRNGKTVDLNKFSFYTFVGDAKSFWFNFNLYETPSIALSAMRSLVSVAKVHNSTSATVNSWAAFLERLYDEHSKSVSTDIGVKIEVEDVNVYLPHFGPSPNNHFLPVLADEVSKNQ